ncbi:hypothetical protein Tco_0674885 [Tanacetum coccineum]
MLQTWTTEDVLATFFWVVVHPEVNIIVVQAYTKDSKCEYAASCWDSASRSSVKSVLLADDCGGFFLFVSFFVSTRCWLLGGVGVGISVSITSGSLLAVVDRAGLIGSAVWIGTGSGAVGGRFVGFYDGGPGGLGVAVAVLVMASEGFERRCLKQSPVFLKCLWCQSGIGMYGSFLPVVLGMEVVSRDLYLVVQPEAHYSPLSENWLDH